jgi:hypothetical protein
MTAPPPPSFRIDRYDAPGGIGWMLRFGPDRGPTVLAAPPLFEEANRTRAAIADVLRRLAARGIAGALPELPGMGESLLPTEAVTLADWRTAFRAAAEALPGPVHVMAWRGGALVDRDAPVASRWWLAPLPGAEVMRDLRRVRAAGGGDLYAGNALSDAMIAQLDAAELPPSAHGAHRIVRLESDPRDADSKVAGRPLWRAAEPGTDAALQAALAEDIAGWIATCAG